MEIERRGWLLIDMGDAEHGLHRIALSVALSTQGIDGDKIKHMKEPLITLTAFIGDNVQRRINHLDDLKVVQKIIWHGNYLKKEMTELSSMDDVTRDACNV